MTKSLCLTAIEGNVGTAPITLAMAEQLKQNYPNLTAFRPFTPGRIEDDCAFRALLAKLGKEADLDRAWGTTYGELLADEEAAMDTLVKRYFEYVGKDDAVLILGHADGDPVYPGLVARIGRTAANLGTTVMPIFSGTLRGTEEIKTVSHIVTRELSAAHAPVTGAAVLNPPADFAPELPENCTHGQIITCCAEKPDLSAADSEILKTAMEYESAVMTPVRFTASLTARAKADRKRIVLPESEDDRVLKAAAEVLRRGVADIILLGEEDAVAKRAGELNLDLGDATVVRTDDPALLEKYATEFARLRARKGVTYEQAYAKVQDVSYFGTMMVHMGDADGMVSGAAHTTAHTIVPSFQIIKTKPNADIVSSCFLMLMADRVYVYGDCAVNTNPTPEQLASIAVSSAETAARFGVTPRVAMLSYSTGTSGKGVDVDAVVQATELARAKAPDLLLEGPIQYDAAVDCAVAAAKLPGSPVAGKANVFIFPSLNAGNIGYKAVQRSAKAVAVGPILQGLNKPVNDLSRGALVEDIVNTVVITAIQAQN